jgi:thioredoxin-dependent peroxiredoxin
MLEPLGAERGRDPRDDVIIVPAVSDEDARRRFRGGWKALKPYLRQVAQPK